MNEWKQKWIDIIHKIQNAYFVYIQYINENFAMIIKRKKKEKKENLPLAILSHSYTYKIFC